MFPTADLPLIVSRWFHLAAVIVAIGGTVFARVVLQQAARLALLALLLGLVVLWLLRQVPLVGGLIGFVALLAGIGALTWRAFNGSRMAAA